MQKLALSLMLFGLAGPALAEDAISTDRPDFTESPEVLDAGRFQLETSGAWQKQKSGGQTTRLRSTPTLLRLGVGHDLELRLETEGALRQTGTSQPSGSGRGDASLGVKWQVSEGGDGRPTLAWLLHVDTPSGSGDFKGHGLRPSVRIAAEWELPAGLSLGVMGGVLTDRNADDQRYTAALASASLAIPLNETLRTFVELAAEQLASSRDGGKVLTAGTGLAWLLSRNAQLDVALTRGLNRNTPDWSGTVGLSLRF